MQAWLTTSCQPRTWLAPVALRSGSGSGWRRPSATSLHLRSRQCEPPRCTSRHFARTATRQRSSDREGRGGLTELGVRPRSSGEWRAAIAHGLLAEQKQECTRVQRTNRCAAVSVPHTSRSRRSMSNSRSRASSSLRGQFAQSTDSNVPYKSYPNAQTVHGKARRD